MAVGIDSFESLNLCMLWWRNDNCAFLPSTGELDRWNSRAHSSDVLLTGFSSSSQQWTMSTGSPTYWDDYTGVDFWHTVFSFPRNLKNWLPGKDHLFMQNLFVQLALRTFSLLKLKQAGRKRWAATWMSICVVIQTDLSLLSFRDNSEPWGFNRDDIGDEESKEHEMRNHCLSVTIQHYSRNVVPKVWCFRKRIKASVELLKPFLASKVPETPYLWH